MLAACGWAGLPSRPLLAQENPFPNRSPAVDLEGGSEWLNVEQPLSLKDLRGKVVLLDFWTFCCINCIHVLPDLKFLEQKYANELVVVGVHSAKFVNERDSDNIRKAILRYEIAHPVINDDKMTIWRKYEVRSWPTLVLIDPEGFYCGYISGEGQREVLDKVLERVIAYHRAKGTLNSEPVRFDVERQRQPLTALRFPGKLLADAANDRLYVSDSNHNRIVVSTLSGDLVDVIGRGTIGAADGGYSEAEFDHPQGMALVGSKLYVADTENHLLRVIDLEAKTVATLAGTGKQARGRDNGGPLKKTALNSPWDLYHLDGVLYIAMAGPHQLWSHQLGSPTVQVYAGSGREDILNGPLADAALAQPSGITSNGSELFVVDSEGSSVRRITTKPKQKLTAPKGAVKTVVGTSDLPMGRSLFEFGDRDGQGNDVRLQHPLGIAFHQGALYVADSYNHKIKKIEIAKGTAATWLGNGNPGTVLEPPQLSEPAGVSIAGDTLYIADTNNHRILATNLETKATREIVIRGLTAPEPVTESLAANLATPDRVVEVPAQAVVAGESVTLRTRLELPNGFKVNPAYPSAFTVTVAQAGGVIAPETSGKRFRAALAGDDQIEMTLPLAAGSGEAQLILDLAYGYCEDSASGLCRLGQLRWKLPLRVGDGTESIVVLPTK